MPRASKIETIRGSLITLRRKCGTPSCRCTRGELHESPALTYSVAGTKKFLTLRDEDVSEVKAALAHYNKVKADLMRQADKGIERLTKGIAADKARARRRR